MEAEKTHARLFSDAINQLKMGDGVTWGKVKLDYYVCTLCGYTSEDPNEHERCPICNLPWGKFEVIS
jgi:rubrerythrin